MNNCYVYRHVRLDTIEVFYIGVGTGKSYGRSKSHRNRNAHWRRIVAKAGYEIEIIADGLSWEEAARKEIEFIALYGRRDLKKGTLVNMCHGGKGGSFGRVVSEETRKAIASANKGRQYSTGHKHSEETKRNMSAARMGRKVSDATRKKLSDANKGQIIPEWQRRLLSELAKNRKNMLGKTHTPEARVKIGAAHKGKIETEETRAKKSTSHVGKKHSSETIEKMRLARFKYYEQRRTANGR